MQTPDNGQRLYTQNCGAVEKTKKTFCFVNLVSGPPLDWYLAHSCLWSQDPENRFGKITMTRAILTATLIRCAASACLVIASLALVSDAHAQRPWPGNGMNQGSSFQFKPGGYQHIGGNVHVNPAGGSLYVPGVGVQKNSGAYAPVGNGYYQNQWTGNVYNPNTGSYSSGKNLSFKPGGYNQIGGNMYHNPATGSVHIPGGAVLKGSGVYTPMGNGYYRNPQSGNIYNPSTGAYKSR